MGADSAVSEALGTIKSLRAGQAPFDVLTPAERAEQLGQLLDAGDTSIPVRHAVKSLTNDRLIELVAVEADVELVAAAAAELTNRMDGPDPDERRRIEDDDEQYHRELTLQRELEADDAPPFAW